MKCSKVAIAALVSLMMIAVPFSFSVDSDALSEGESGISFTGKNISEEDYEILEDVTSEEDIRHTMEIIGLELNRFNIQFTQISYPLMSSAMGYKVVGNDVTFVEVYEYSSAFDFTYTFDDYANLPFDGLTEEGVSSLITYLGVNGFSPGDGLKVSGKCYYSYSYTYYDTYRDVNDVYCIMSENTVDMFAIYDYDLDITYYPRGAPEGKTFSVVVDGGIRQIFDADYVYDGDAPTAGYNSCFVDYTDVRKESSLGFNVVFDGSDHVLTPISMFYTPEDGRDIMYAEEKSEIEYSADNLVEIDDLYDSRLTDSKLKNKLESLGTVTYTYSSVVDLMNGLIGGGDNDDDGDGGKKLPLIIGGGVLGAAAIGGVVFFLIRRG